MNRPRKSCWLASIETASFSCYYPSADLTDCADFPGYSSDIRGYSMNKTGHVRGPYCTHASLADCQPSVACYVVALKIKKFLFA